MLFKNQDSGLLARTKLFAKATLVMALHWSVTGCATLYQYLDTERVVTPESSAVVGPLLQNEGQDKVQNEVRESEKNKTSPNRRQPNKADQASPAKTGTVAKGQSKPTKADHTRSQKPVAAASGTIQGSIKILGAGEKNLSPEGTILTLTPAAGTAAANTAEPQTHIIDMENKTYLPKYITIGKNDRLSFVNKDNIKHNVFSSTGKNAFDLGTYGKGMRRDVALSEQGIVKVYCNIHPEMAMFVSVSDTRLSTVVEENGSFEIGPILPGQYNLHIWHIRGEETLTVNIEANRKTTLNTTLNTAGYKKEKHKNKFGRNYRKTTRYGTGYGKKSTILDDEFL